MANQTSFSQRHLTQPHRAISCRGTALLLTLCAWTLFCHASNCRAETEQERGNGLIELLRGASLELVERKTTAPYCKTLLQDLLSGKVQFVEPTVETDDANDPTFGILAHCASGSKHWGHLSEGEQPFADIKDLGDSHYRLYVLTEGSPDSAGYVAVYANVGQGKELYGPVWRVNGYSIIDRRRCVIEGKDLIRSEPGYEERAAIAWWKTRWLVFSLTRTGRRPPYSDHLWASDVSSDKRSADSKREVLGCDWH